MSSLIKQPEAKCWGPETPLTLFVSTPGPPVVCKAASLGLTPTRQDEFGSSPEGPSHDLVFSTQGLSTLVGTTAELSAQISVSPTLAFWPVEKVCALLSALVGEPAITKHPESLVKYLGLAANMERLTHTTLTFAELKTLARRLGATDPLRTTSGIHWSQNPKLMSALMVQIPGEASPFSRWTRDDTLGFMLRHLRPPVRVGSEPETKTPEKITLFQGSYDPVEILSTRFTGPENVWGEVIRTRIEVIPGPPLTMPLFLNALSFTWARDDDSPVVCPLRDSFGLAEFVKPKARTFDKSVASLLALGFPEKKKTGSISAVLRLEHMAQARWSDKERRVVQEAMIREATPFDSFDVNYVRGAGEPLLRYVIRGWWVRNESTLAIPTDPLEAARFPARVMVAGRLLTSQDFEVSRDPSRSSDENPSR